MDHASAAGEVSGDWAENRTTPNEFSSPMTSGHTSGEYVFGWCGSSNPPFVTYYANSVIVEGHWVPCVAVVDVITGNI